MEASGGDVLDEYDEDELVEQAKRQDSNPNVLQVITVANYAHIFNWENIQSEEHK